MCHAVVLIYRPCRHKNSFRPIMPCCAGWSRSGCRANNLQIIGHEYITSRSFCAKCFRARRLALYRCFRIMKRKFIEKAQSENWNNTRMRSEISGLQKQYRREANDFEQRCQRFYQEFVEMEVALLGSRDY